MIPRELNDWLQVVGLFGVLGGLIFVGLQLRLDRQVAMTQRTADAVASRQVWAELVNSNIEVWAKGLAGEPLSEAEALRFDTLADARRLFYFSSWQGAIAIAGAPPERFAWDFAAELLKYPGLRRWWQDWLSYRGAQRQRSGEDQGNFSAVVSEELNRLETEAEKY